MADDLIERLREQAGYLALGLSLPVDVTEATKNLIELSGCAADALASKDKALSEARQYIAKLQTQNIMEIGVAVHQAEVAGEALSEMRADRDAIKGLLTEEFRVSNDFATKLMAARAELEAVKAGCEYWSSETARVCGEASALRKALEPFAKIADAHDDEHELAMSVGGYVPVERDYPMDGTPLGLFHDAREALAARAQAEGETP